MEELQKRRENQCTNGGGGGRGRGKKSERKYKLWVVTHAHAHRSNRHLLLLCGEETMAAWLTRITATTTTHTHTHTTVKKTKDIYIKKRNRVHSFPLSTHSLHAQSPPHAPINTTELKRASNSASYRCSPRSLINEEEGNMRGEEEGRTCRGQQMENGYYFVLKQKHLLKGALVR